MGTAVAAQPLSHWGQGVFLLQKYVLWAPAFLILEGGIQLCISPVGPSERERGDMTFGGTRKALKPLISSMTMSKTASLSEPPCPHLLNGHKKKAALLTASLCCYENSVRKCLNNPSREPGLEAQHATNKVLDIGTLFCSLQAVLTILCEPHTHSRYVLCPHMSVY